jgi:uncharacterized protein (UPF0332 family)
MERHNKLFKTLSRSQKQMDKKIVSLEMKFEEVKQSIKKAKIFLFLVCGLICLSLFLSIITLIK